MHAVLDKAPEKPWYRQFWPWFIMALPAAAVAASLSTVAIAVINKDSLVRDDWYQDGKSINLDVARDRLAKTQDIRADLNFDSVTGEVRAQLQGRLKGPDTLTLTLSHVTLAGLDQTLILKRQQDGRYLGLLQKSLQGNFDIELGNTEWRLDSSDRFPRSDLHLEPN